MKMIGLPRWSDQNVEDLVGNLLRAGVILSAAVVFAGAVVYLARHGGQPADYRVFRGEPGELRTIPGVLHETFSFQGRGIIQFGLLLLIATPVARVALSIVGFAAERDWMYVGFASIVLLILLYSLFGSSQSTGNAGVGWAKLGQFGAKEVPPLEEVQGQLEHLGLAGGKVERLAAVGRGAHGVEFRFVGFTSQFPLHNHPGSAPGTGDARTHNAIRHLFSV
jgi:uncharacterized membrane protein